MKHTPVTVENIRHFIKLTGINSANTDSLQNMNTLTFIYILRGVIPVVSGAPRCPDGLLLTASKANSIRSSNSPFLVDSLTV